MKHGYWLWLLLLVLLMPVLAQESSTETPPPTETASVTAIPTIEPRPIPPATAEPLPTATELPSASPTEMPSVTPVPTETSTATLAPTDTPGVTPTASETLLGLETMETVEVTPTETASPMGPETATLTMTLSETPSITATVTSTPYALPMVPAVSLQSSGSVIAYTVATMEDLQAVIDAANNHAGTRYVIRLLPPAAPDTYHQPMRQVGGWRISGDIVIYAEEGSEVILDGSHWTSSGSSDGTRMFTIIGGGRLLLVNLTFRNFQHNGGSGAVIHVDNTGELYTRRVRFENNSNASGSGTGGAITNVGTFYAWQSVFHGNSTIFGGSLRNTSSGVMDLRCSTFSNNSAQITGGVLLMDAYSQVLITQSNFTGNTTTTGEGLVISLFSAGMGANALGNYWMPAVDTDNEFTAPGSQVVPVLTGPIDIYNDASCLSYPPAFAIPEGMGGPTPTPTATPTTPVCPVNAGLQSRGVGDGSLASQSASPVQIISFATYQTYPAFEVQVLIDMLILPEQLGPPGLIQLLENPTINARKTGRTYPWSSFFTVYARMSFPQIVNGQQDEQIWYQIGDNASSEPEGWLPVRYNGRDYLTVSDPCQSDPSMLSTPEAFTFVYDRRAAANYAIEHSYDTAFNHNSMQSEGRTTQRIGNLGVPYAFFDYSDIVGGNQTGSAAFVSESIWMGGMPMTVGNPNSCGEPVEGDVSYGWRYCFDVKTPSNSWDSHGDLVIYWFEQGTVLGQANKGRSIRIAGLAGSPFSSKNELRIIGRQTTFDNTGFTDLHPYIRSLGGGELENPAGLSVYVQSILTTNPLNVQEDGTRSEVLQGDYVRTIPVYPPTEPQSGQQNTSKSEHGLIVVGWQEALECRPAIFVNSQNVDAGYRLWTVDDFGVSYADAINRGIPNPVPWVADFTAPPNYDGLDNATQSPVPRPFYCTMFWEEEPSSGIPFDRFYSHDWLFYHFPLEVTVQASQANDQLYVDPNWLWNEDE